MGAQAAQDWQAGVASALEWWSDAGVDVLVEDAPRDWLVRPAMAAEAAKNVAATLDAAPEILPTSVADFEEWRLSSAAPEHAWHRPLVRPTGSAQNQLVIFADMPCDSDQAVLMDGPSGQLLDRMLAAIGLDRDSVYVGALTYAHPLGQRIPMDQAERLIQLARHHLTLLKPERLLLFGPSAERLLDSPPNEEGEITPFGCTTRVAMTYHPRFLLERPAAKREAWKALLQLTRGSQ